MERWKALIIFLCLCAAAYGQDSARIGLDMAETVGNGNIRIVISHTFAPQWSAGGSASFRIINDIASYMDFPEAGLSEWEISFRHWAKECYKGGYISLGMTGGFRQNADIKTGIGFSIPIYRGLGIDIGYGIRMLHTVRHKELYIKDFTFELHYAF